MYKIIDTEGNTYCLYKYEKENEFEKMIVQNALSIFGRDGIYFDIKKKIGLSKKGATIPDGYFLDLTFHNDPKLYLVEIELNSHTFMDISASRFCVLEFHRKPINIKLSSTCLLILKIVMKRKQFLLTFSISQSFQIKMSCLIK